MLSVKTVRSSRNDKWLTMKFGVIAAFAVLCLLLIGRSADTVRPAPAGDVLVKSLVRIQPLLAGQFEGSCLYSSSASYISCSFNEGELHFRGKVSKVGEADFTLPARPLSLARTPGDQLSGLVALREALNSEGKGDRTVVVKFQVKGGLRIITTSSWKELGLFDKVLLRSSESRFYSSVFDSEIKARQIGGTK